ncbi:MAG: hypothetical protein GY724_10305 [Actinomycetia bacterium]|nr:hypothetical protein [Actinomycetes bacterium]MCP5035829.1 hypothetical protein [Actinomycetes bacterium]
MADTIVRGHWVVPFTTETVEVSHNGLIRVRYVGGAFRGMGTWTFTDLDDGSTEIAYRWPRSTRPTSEPATSCSAAVITGGVGDGSPQSIQIIGPRFAEMACLTAAETIERTVAVC